MKKILIAPALALFVGIFGTSSDANADPTPVQTAAPALRASPAIAKFVITSIKGEITVPATFSSGNYGNGPVALGQGGFGCGNLVMIANSKEVKPRPPGYTGFWIDQPVWTRGANATGTWSSGKCNYSIAVPAEQQFYLTAGTNGSWDCSVVQLEVTNTPSYQSVAKGTSKTDNVTIPKVTCIVIG